MSLDYLGASRAIDVSKTVEYVAKEGCPNRSMTLFVTDTLVGGVRPMVLVDPGFWSAPQYDDIIKSIVNASTRNWADGARKNSTGINKTHWTGIRGAKHQQNEMVGVLLGRLTYNNASEYVIAAAPNQLYDNKKSVGYIDHTSKAAGTQIHSEMFMAGQLRAFLVALKAAKETVPNAKAPRAGLSAGPLTVDVDMFIEKGTLCQGCSGTWKTLADNLAKLNPLITVTHRLC